MNLPSSNVAVYPSARRANQADVDTYRNSRLVGEKSIIDIVKHVLDFDSFVISDAFVYGSNFEFILGGYYFSIIITSEDVTQSGSLYAYIDIDTTDEDFAELTGEDTGGNDSVYTGLNVVSSVPGDAGQNTTRYYLRILDWDATAEQGAGKWVIPKESKYKFYFTNIYMSNIDEIDCGTVPSL